MLLPCLPSSSPVCLLFLLFILPVLLFISVYATHIVPLPLSCSHLIFIQQLVKPLLSLIYHSASFPCLLIALLSWLCCFHYYIPVTSKLYSHLSFLPCFSSQFCFNCHIPCTTYLPLLFAHFVLFLFYFVGFIITCTIFLPFPCFIYFYPTVQCRLTHVDFP